MNEAPGVEEREVLAEEKDEGAREEGSQLLAMLLLSELTVYIEGEVALAPLVILSLSMDMTSWERFGWFGDVEAAWKTTSVAEKTLCCSVTSVL